MVSIGRILVNRHWQDTGFPEMLLKHGFNNCVCKNCRLPVAVMCYSGQPLDVVIFVPPGNIWRIMSSPNCCHISRNPLKVTTILRVLSQLSLRFRSSLISFCLTFRFSIICQSYIERERIVSIRQIQLLAAVCNDFQLKVLVPTLLSGIIVAFGVSLALLVMLPYTRENLRILIILAIATIDSKIIVVLAVGGFAQVYEKSILVLDRIRINFANLENRTDREWTRHVYEVVWGSKNEVCRKHLCR